MHTEGEATPKLVVLSRAWGRAMSLRLWLICNNVINIARNVQTKEMNNGTCNDNSERCDNGCSGAK